MKTTNTNQPGERSHGITRGHVGRGRAGTPGITLRDAATTAQEIVDLTVIGGVVIDNDDGSAVLGISGNGPATFSVIDYGAVGDGTTDDTAAINVAIAALVATGFGILYFPVGTYLVTGALTTISVPCVVRGQGSGAWDLSSYVTKIECSSQTAVLFTFTGGYFEVRDIALENTYAGTPTSASRGIQQTPTTGLERFTIQNVAVKGFYNNIDVGGGTGWMMSHCWIYGPVNYGIRIRNTVIPDAGDWVISATDIFSAIQDAAAGIRIESSGGGKIIGCKINKALDNKLFTYGIDGALGAGAITSILLVSATSIENSASHCLNIASTSTGTYPYIIITGCQMAPYNATGSAVRINAAATGDLDHGLIIGCAFATLIGSTTYAISFTNVDDWHIDIASIEFGGGVYTTSGTVTNIRDLSTVAGYSSTLPSADGTAATGSSESPARIDHVHPSSGAVAGEILIVDNHSTPLIFADLLQNEAGDDLLYYS